ncbi:hypothetical protein KKD49_18650 [Myxococcota bacterium]|nr:hypothetical protein [Myxococcota bacterium]
MIITNKRWLLVKGDGPFGPEPARHEMTPSLIARGEGCSASEPLVKIR